MPSPTTFRGRVRALSAGLRELPDLAVAFSGGVDSAVLLHAAHAALGPRAVGLVADSPSLPRRELDEARRLARAIGARLRVLATDELDDPDYVANAGRRCYFCKRTLFRAMAAWAAANGFTTLAFGEITDDLGDERPGAVAAAELGVVAPLRAAGMDKADVRRYAREHGLAVADKPASACLASRIPVGTPVTIARLRAVEDAEDRLRALGLRVLRVRHRGSHARIEVGADELALARSRRGALDAALRAAGFATSELAAYVPPGSGHAPWHAISSPPTKITPR